MKAMQRKNSKKNINEKNVLVTLSVVFGFAPK